MKLTLTDVTLFLYQIISIEYSWDIVLLKTICLDFPGGAVVKNPPANAGDTGSIPGLGRSHMPWSS